MTEHQTGPKHVHVMDVYVTNQCNQGCLSCFVNTVKSKRGAVHLKWDDFKNAIDVFMDPKTAPAAARKEIAIAGGEPFLDYPLLLKTVKYVRRFPERPYVYIHTNGTLVRPEWIRELRVHGAGIVFSIDGDKVSHDRYRPLTGSPKESGWNAIMETLRDLPKEGLGTNTVLRPDNVGTMLESLDRFHRAGLRFCDLWIDYLLPWKDDDLRDLRDFTDEFSYWYVERTKKDGRIPFFVGAMAHALFQAAHRRRGEAWWKKCFRVTLGADGNFYDCEAIGFATYARARKDHAVRHASAGKGIDWAKREEYMARADAALEEMGCVEGWQHVCPRLYFAVGEFMGRDPRPMIDNLHRVSELFYGEWVKLSAKLRGHPDFIRAYLSDKLPHLCGVETDRRPHHAASQ